MGGMDCGRIHALHLLCSLTQIDGAASRRLPGCHPALKRPWDQGRFLVKFCFEPLLCYCAERNIIKRSSDDVAEGEWVRA